ncbi:MAG TPA: hypothetical protein VL574_16265 [Stellaceae bacterium]|nr:hypothetical protein [Stellaceae bacterium]
MPKRTALLFGLAVLLAALGLWLGLKSPPSPQPAVVAIAPMAPAPPAPPSAPKPEPSKTEAPKPAPLPALPTVNVATVPIHAPPAESAAPAGRPLDLRKFEATLRQGAATTAHPAVTAAQTTKGGAAPREISGPARVTSATGLIVGGVPVELYGIEHVTAGDRCGGGSCEQAAIEALQARLSRGSVSCRSPRRNLGVVAFAICLDSSGVDLGGMLVGDGLALANRRESKDYVGAERVARDLRHGLWQSR